VQLTCCQTLLEIDELLKYVDRAESELQSAEHVSADPETLAMQLSQHKVHLHTQTHMHHTQPSQLVLAKPALPVKNCTIIPIQLGDVGSITSSPSGVRGAELRPKTILVSIMAVSKRLIITSGCIVRHV